MTEAGNPFALFSTGAIPAITTLAATQTRTQTTVTQQTTSQSASSQGPHQGAPTAEAGAADRRGGPPQGNDNGHGNDQGNGNGGDGRDPPKVRNLRRGATQRMNHLLHQPMMRTRRKRTMKTKKPRMVTALTYRVNVTEAASERLKRLSFSNSLKDLSGALGARIRCRPSCPRQVDKTTVPTIGFGGAKPKSLIPWIHQDLAGSHSTENWPRPSPNSLTVR